MDLKTTIMLRKIFQSNEYNEESFNLCHMFKAFSTFAISSFADISNAPLNFIMFLEENRDCINFKSQEDSTKFYAEYPKFIKNIDSHFNSPAKPSKDTFMKACLTLAPSKDQTKMLDVGSGIVPYSSMIMAQEVKHVSSMDKFILSEECLSKFNVNAIDSYFDDSTNISDYDFIVGKKACSAIEPIVKSASIANKPYFLQLCTCELTKRAWETDGKFRTWQEILPQYDSNIQFFDNYAFNIDATSGQVGKLLEQSIPNETFPNIGKAIVPILGLDKLENVPDILKPSDGTKPSDDFEDFILSIN